jgi:hypothetical protein
MAFEKIINHPDKNAIIRMLINGDGVRAVAKYLREKYPRNKKLHLTANTLQRFRVEKLNIEGEALGAIKEASKQKKEIVAEEQLDRQIKRNPFYQEKIKEALNFHVDLQKELKEMALLIKSRIEDLFDRAQKGEITVNEEANLQRYFQSWVTLLERWAKYVEKIADKTVETNINVTVIEDQMTVIREAIRETLSELQPEVAIKFLDKINLKMANLSYRAPKQVEFSDIRDDVHMLADAIDAEVEDD